MKKIEENFLAKLKEDFDDYGEALVIILATVYDFPFETYFPEGEIQRIHTKYLVRNSVGGLDCKYKIFNFEPEPVKTIDFVDLAEKVRVKFKGIRPLSMGDKADCVAKMKRFIKEYPQYTEEDILKATDRYIEITPPVYIRRANYFIYKHTNKGEEISTLASILENPSLSPSLPFNTSVL